MRFSDEYLDSWDKPTSLTAEELSYFWDTVDCVRSALGVDVEICNRDHERAFTGKSKNANGCFYISVPKNPAGECFITIDNFFIHECYQEKFHGELNLSFETLEHVLCHEIAHMSKFRHGKGHTSLTEELFEIVQEYQKEKVQPVLDFEIEKEEVSNMQIVDRYGINDGSLIFTVELAEKRLVDVKVCGGNLDGNVYVMQNEDGSTVYTGEWVPNGTVAGYAYDENAVIQLVKDVLQKEKSVVVLDEMISESEQKCFEANNDDSKKNFADFERSERYALSENLRER